MTDGAWTKEGLDRLDEVMAGHVGPDDVPGAAWLVARHGVVHAGAAGTLDRDHQPVRRDSIFRIASMTKPVTAVAALLLVEDCTLHLDDPLDRWLPELADRQVLIDPRRSIEHTVPAVRPPTVHDALTFRLGWGMDFEHFDSQPLLAAMAEAIDTPIGPPQPRRLPPPDEWIARIGAFPLESQPGERWLYNTGSDVLGVLVGRAAGRPFEEVLRERIFDALGMDDTDFSVPAAKLDRFGSSFIGDTGEGPAVFDPPDGQWSSPPAFCSGAGGLVSTVDDFARFAQMLLDGGAPLLSPASVAAMTTDQLVGTDGVAQAGPDPTGAVGWGFGVGVQRRRTGVARSAGTYGWDGGMGSTWANDPTEGVIGILLTNQLFSSPALPPICQDFWTCTSTAVAPAGG